MHSLADFIRVYDDALTPDFCSQLINGFERATDLQRRNGRGVREGLSGMTGNCHVPKKLQAKSMAGAVHAATVARRDVSIASARNAHGPARDDAER